MPTPHGPLAVVFDLDGLMINTEEIYDEVGDQVLRRRGKRFTPDLKDQMMGRQGNDAVQIMIDWHGLADSVQDLQAESDQLFKQILPDRLAPMPGLLPLLQQLQSAAIPTGIATSSRRQFVERALALLNIPATFKFILAAEDIVHGKPHPEIYLAAAEALQLPPHRLLVLEDSEVGCRASVAAGAFTVAVPGNHSRHHQFDGVKIIADTLADPRIRQAVNL